MEYPEKDWVQGVVNSGSGEISEDDLHGLLLDPDLTDQDIRASIQFVSDLLSLKAVPHLLSIVIDKDKSLETRDCAASAIWKVLDGGSKDMLIRALEEVGN